MSPKEVLVQFFCKMQGFDKRTIVVEMDSLKTISDVADILSPELQVNADVIHLIHDGKVRRRDETLEKVKIQKGSTIFVSLADVDDFHYESNGEAQRRRNRTDGQADPSSRGQAGPSSSLASTDSDGKKPSTEATLNCDESLDGDEGRSRKPPGHTRKPVVFQYKVHGGNYAGGELQMESYFTLRELCEEVGRRHGIKSKNLKVISGRKMTIQPPEQTIELTNIARGDRVNLILAKEEGEQNNQS